MEGNNSGLIYLLVVLSLLVFILGGYIVYDNLIKDKLDNNNTLNEEVKDIISSEEKKDEQNDGNIKYFYTLKNRSYIQAVREGNIEVIVDKEGNAYITVSGNLDYVNDTFIKNNLIELQSNFKTYSPKDYVYYDGSTTTLEAYKLDLSGVLTVYNVYLGNGGFSYFVFLKQNGRLAYLSYDELINKGEIFLKDIKEIENVVSVVENTYTMTPYAVTKEGNEISLDEYILDI